MYTRRELAFTRRNISRHVFKTLSLQLKYNMIRYITKAPNLPTDYKPKNTDDMILPVSILNV